MNLLLGQYLNRFWVSRTKTLLKRRKKHIKGRQISKKKRQQESKHFNYAKQYKALQIQKQLDKRHYANQHINQLMDQIFYPDVTLTNEQSAKIFMDSSAIKQYNQVDLQADPDEQQIRSMVLASELIQFYLQSHDRLTIRHFLIICSKLDKYFTNFDKIKSNIQRNWAKMNQNMKKKDKNYVQKKCPYIFIDRQDVFHYEPWNTMIQIFKNQIKEQLESNQENKNQSLSLFSQAIKLVGRAVQYIPLSLFQQFYKQLINLDQKLVKELDVQQCLSLLRTVNLRKKVRYPSHINIPPLQNPEGSGIAKNVYSLLMKILQNKKMSSNQFREVINTLKMSKIKLDVQLEQKIRRAVLSNLSDMSFEDSLNVFEIYKHNGRIKDLQLIQILKFDILRKSSNASTKGYLFKCINLVHNRYIHFKTQKNIQENIDNQNQNLKVEDNNKLYGFDLLNQCLHNLSSKFCGKNMLTSKQILELVNIYFMNQVHKISLLQLLANQLVKVRQQVSLGQLSQSVFKIYLLGYKSYVLARILFEQQRKRYHQSKKGIQNKQVLLLTGQTNEMQQYKKYYTHQSKTSIQQIKLEQNLIITLWLLLRTHQETNQNKNILPVTLENLMTVYPTTISSRSPLIYQMCQYLNTFSKKNKVLWVIKCIPPNIQQDKVATKNRLNKYYYRCRSPTVNCMMLQAKQSKMFVQNYHVGQKKFIPYSWSTINEYKVEDYINFLKQNKNSSKNYFNSDQIISEKIADKRREIVEYFESRVQQEDRKAKQQNKQQNILKQQKMYQLD